MTTVGMYYDVISGKADVFLAKFREIVEVLDRTAGHRVTYLYRRVDDPDSFAVLSEWDDQESFLRFIRSDTFRQVTAWGREEVLRNAPRHKVYPRTEEVGRPSAS